MEEGDATDTDWVVLSRGESKERFDHGSTGFGIIS